MAYLAAAQAERGMFAEAKKTLEEVAIRRPDHPFLTRVPARIAHLEQMGTMEVKPIDAGGGDGD